MTQQEISTRSKSAEGGGLLGPLVILAQFLGGEKSGKQVVQGHSLWVRMLSHGMHFSMMTHIGE